VNRATRAANIQKLLTNSSLIDSDVNKDLDPKVKAKAKDLMPEATDPHHA